MDGKRWVETVRAGKELYKGRWLRIRTGEGSMQGVVDSIGDLWVLGGGWQTILATCGLLLVGGGQYWLPVGCYWWVADNIGDLWVATGGWHTTLAPCGLRLVVGRQHRLHVVRG